MSRRVFAVSAALTFLALIPVDPPVVAAPGDVNGKELYIVRLSEQPVAAYEGNIQGFAATRAPKGQRFNPRTPHAARYSQYLRARHDSVLASVGPARKIYSYSFAVNGFAAELTEAQAQKLRATAGVVSVTKNQLLKLNTLTTPQFLDLDKKRGIWDALGGPKNAGDDVIVGIIDSGIWPEHPAFAPLKQHRGVPPGWEGACEAGEQFPATTCNDKLIGARYFHAGFGTAEDVKALFPYEYISPRAAEGHGVHVAATAVGNHHVRASVEGINLGKVSGMAPGARLAVYKACWGFSEETEAGCFSVDTVAAIDAAVADGVHILNYSIGGSTTTLVDSVQFAFLVAAANADIFVASSAGNDGPFASTVEKNAPWITSVGASTHDRIFKADVVLDKNRKYEGVSLHDKNTGEKPMILSSAAALPGADPTEAALCFPNTLDPKKVKGKIVVCDRGVNARVEKSQVVKDAGGVGMVLVNITPGTLNPDLHSVPTVHVDHIVGPKIKAYVASTSKAKGRLTKGTADTGNRAPTVAGFSARGPALAANGDLLKPDIIAPGVEVLAAYSPVQTGHDYEFLQGTSMSSPHIAGIAALLRHAHPDWSASAIRSAMMTTASPLRNDFRPIDQFQEDEVTRERGSALSYGAGWVRPNAALDPGLVYDSGVLDWLRFLCGQDIQVLAGFPCTPANSIDASDLNYPSIAIGDLTFTQTVTRTVTNVSRHHSLYVALVDEPKGIKVDVSPKILSIKPGESKSFTVKFTVTNRATVGEYAEGSLTWIDGRHYVRSPLVVRPVPLSVPAEVSGNGQPISYNVQFGYSGPFNATSRGLIPATLRPGTVIDDPDDDLLAGGLGGVTAIFPVTIPQGTTYARFSLFDDFTSGMGGDDLDLYLVNANTGIILAVSGNISSNEEINMPNPTPGNYLLVVHGFDTASGGATNFTLFQWLLGTASAGNMTITVPPNATAGQSGTVTLDFTGLSAGTKYLGSVVYGGAAAMPAPTIVRVDP
jgi:hypothetical protein